MSAEQIAFIRTARGAGVSWRKIAGHTGHSVSECRSAIGLPPIAKESAARPVLPWDLQQRSLFDE